MTFLEHGILLSQIILTAKYGTYMFMIFIVPAYLCFLAANIAWVFVFRKEIIQKDIFYKNWRNRKAHIWARRMMNAAGVIGNWRAYKLSYSSFWGFRLTPAKFSYVGNFRNLQKKFLWINIISCYALVIIGNLVSLFTMNWGTQLYIQMLENIIIFLLVVWAGLWEQN